MARSLASGARQANPAATGSICDAILTPTPGMLTLPILQRLAGPGLAVTDDQALQAMALAFTHLRIVLEPGGAVALAAALFAPTCPACDCRRDRRQRRSWDLRHARSGGLRDARLAF